VLLTSQLGTIALVFENNLLESLILSCLNLKIYYLRYLYFGVTSAIFNHKAFNCIYKTGGIKRINGKILFYTISRIVAAAIKV
jgi:hypothetical protein